MATIREQILAAILTALNTGTPGGVPMAVRGRTMPYEAAQLPAMALYPVREEVENAGGRFGPIVKRRLTFNVEIRATGALSDQVLDPITAWLTKALAGNTLGSLTHEIEEVGTEWSVEAADKTFGMATVTFAARYQTKTADQEAKA